MKPSFSRAINLTSDAKCAAIYARVLTEDQGKDFSIPTQIDACQKRADREGYTIAYQWVCRSYGLLSEHTGLDSQGGEGWR
jgi:DNA invertase Pin-like site-specific DNA recombinase